MTTPNRTGADKLRHGAGHALFMGTMIGASVLTFLRMTVVAVLLPIGDFGLYATVIATGAFLAGPLSFGIIEGTIKSFPRLVAQDLNERMLADARSIWRIAAMRALVLAAPLLGVGLLADVSFLLLAGMGVLAAFGNAATSLVASMQRAAGSPGTLAGGTLFRAALTFAMVSLAAFSQDAMVVIGVEIASILIASVFSDWYFFRRFSSNTCGGPPAAADLTASGFRTFICFTMISVPFYLDRLFVTSSMGVLEGGQYGVLALLLMGASLIVNTIAQRAGPHAIKQVQSGETWMAITSISGWIVLSSALWLVAIASFAAVVASDMLPENLERYAIGGSMLLPLALAGVFLNTGLLEFLVIAMDREVDWLFAAGLFLGVILAGAVFIWTFSFCLVDFMWLLVVARAIYAISLTWIVTHAASLGRDSD